MSLDNLVGRTLERANGLRTLTSQVGHHQTALQTLPLTIGLPKDRMILLDALHKQRNLADYEGEPCAEAIAFRRAMFCPRFCDRSAERSAATLDGYGRTCPQ